MCEMMLAWTRWHCVDDEKWSYSGYIPNAEILGFIDGLDRGNEKKIGIKSDSLAFCYRLWVNGGAIFQGDKTAGEKGFKVWIWGEENNAPEGIRLGSIFTFYTRQYHVASTNSGAHFKMTCSLQTLFVICLLILFIFIDSDLGVYFMSQASILEEFEFPLLFFLLKLFFPSTSCCFCMVGDTYSG